MGRTAAGVMAIRLLGKDEVISLDVVMPDHDLLILHERGWGKRVPLDEYNAKGRYTQGNWTTDYRRLDEIGPIVAARVVGPERPDHGHHQHGHRLAHLGLGHQPHGAVHPRRAGGQPAKG